MKTYETIYEVADQSVIWVDRDACEALLKEAENRGYTSIQALPLLERALGHLERGELLEGENGTWVYGLRKKSEDMLRQCRIWLAEAYEAQGKLWQVGEQYRAMILTDPSDEEALQRWLEMLARHGKRQEALKCYEEMKDFVEAQGFPLSKALEQVVAFMESQEDVNRREATKRISTLVGGLLLTAHQPSGLMQIGAMLHDEEILAICTTSIPILWRLYFDGQLSEVRRVLPGYLSQLALLTRQSRYQQQAARAASKAHQLACMLALQEQDYGFALIHADQAFFGATIADDAHLQVASLIRRALAYRYLKRFQPMLEAYQEADQYSKSISPLLQGRLYTGLAEAHSNFEREYEAEHFLELAYTTFPENPLDDPHFSYTHFKLPQGFEAVMYLNLKQPKKAWGALAHVDKSLPEAIVPDRVELSIDQAKAFLLLGEITQSCQYLKFAAVSASALGSALRYNEASSLYQQMQRQWPREQQVKDLAGYFQ